jgi:glycyl-tRNA synthetase beta chain
MMQQTFLVEIGTEELPPKALRSLGEAFASQLRAQLASISLSHGEINWFATPRRLAVKVAGLHTRQPDREVEKRGPAVAQAYDANGKATQAAEGWARSCGIQIAEAERLVTDKGEWLFHRSRIAGKPAEALLAEAVNNALAKLPVTKLMRWGDNDDQFVRPVRTVTLLLGEALIPGVVMGIHSDRVISGHRFMGAGQLVLENADQYPQLLSERGNVIADYAMRKDMIKRDVMLAAEKLGGVADVNESLLEEVTSLVEWPVVLVAGFEERFLAVPPEALVYTMKVDQRYFPMYDAAGKLMPHFIFVANIASRDPQQVIAGNEKVVRPRLADAEFFFTMDRKIRLEDYLPRLEAVVFQQHLGTLRDKTDRVQRLTGWVATQTGADAEQAMRAGLLSKCDLVTSMVFEFPETQGVMGMHYARFDGEREEVALALNEQYQPRFSGDALPQAAVSRSLAIADKMDTLTGLIGSGQHPHR